MSNGKEESYKKIREAKKARAKTVYNPANALYNKLTKFFSGPIVKFKTPDITTTNKFIEAQHDFNSPFHTPFKRSEEYFLINEAQIEQNQEVNRMERYVDFENMELSPPEIKVALDIYADEISCYTEFSPILKIVCPKDEIREILRSLFYDTLNVPMNLFRWVRSMCAKGDFFLFLDIDPKLGVIGTKALPTMAIQRLEGEDPTNPNYTQFQWNDKGITFENVEVAHFRILGNDKFYPYGTCLKYDTKIYTKDGIKEIQHINKNDIVLTFDNEMQTFVPTKVLDTINSGKKQCYKISTRHNFVELSEEHNVLTINLNNKFEYKNTLDIKLTDRLVLKKKHNCDQRIKIDKTIPIENKNGWWNNNSNIPEYVTEDFANLFGFLIGDGWIHNGDICFAEGVYPEINKKYIDILGKLSGKIVRRVGSSNRNSQFEQQVCSSKMFKTILQRMEFKGKALTKRLPNWIFSASRDIQLAFLEGIYNSDGSSFIDKWGCERFSIELNNKSLIQDIKCLVQCLGFKSGKIGSRLRKPTKIGNREIRTEHKSYYFYYFKSEIAQSAKQDIDNRRNNEFIIEPVVSIEKGDACEVYDIYVENYNHNFIANGVVVHNSVIDAARKITKQLNLMIEHMMTYRIVRSAEKRAFYYDVGGMSSTEQETYLEKAISKTKRQSVIDASSGHLDLRYNVVGVEEDYHIPTRKGSETRIEPLPGGQFVGDIEDIEFLRDQLFTSLKIPGSYLTNKNSDGEQSSLAQKSMLFAKEILRIQNSVVAELRKIAMVHLLTLGYSGKDLLSFDIRLNNPSKLAEMQEFEHLKLKSEAASLLSDHHLSKRWIQSNIFGFSPDEIKQNVYEILGDAKFQAILSNIENQVSGGGVPGLDGSGGEGGLGGRGGGAIPGLDDMMSGEGENGQQGPVPNPEDEFVQVGDKGSMLPPGEQGRRTDKDANYLTPNSLKPYETRTSRGKAYNRTVSDGRNQRFNQMNSTTGRNIIRPIDRVLLPGYASVIDGIYPESVAIDSSQMLTEENIITTSEQNMKESIDFLKKTEIERKERKELLTKCLANYKQEEVINKIVKERKDRTDEYIKKIRFSGRLQ